MSLENSCILFKKDAIEVSRVDNRIVLEFIVVYC